MPSQSEGKRVITAAKERQAPITFGVESLPLSKGEFLHHREKRCQLHCSVKASNYLQATINCGLGLITGSTDSHYAFKDLCGTIILLFIFNICIPFVYPFLLWKLKICHLHVLLLWLHGKDYFFVKVIS